MMKLAPSYEEIIFINDFHSALPEWANFIDTLIARKLQGATLVDLGDFSEGHSFYEHTHGRVERALMWSIFDVLIPGNHGFRDISELHESCEGKVVNCNIFRKDGLLFAESKTIRVWGSTVALVWAISLEAFSSIPRDERKGLRAEDPIVCVKKAIAKIRHSVEYLVLCSHCGTDFDRKHFADIEGIDAILSAHCHTPWTNFDRHDKMIRKAQENGNSMGVLRVNKSGIHIHDISIRAWTGRFRSAELLPLNTDLESYEKSFNAEIGVLNNEAVGLLSDRKLLLERLISSAATSAACDYLVNYTCFRQASTGPILSRKNLHDLMPFDTHFLVLNDLPERYELFRSSLPREIFQASLGKISIPGRVRTPLLTTDYLYENFYPKGSEQIASRIRARELLSRIITI